jgi:hypothetical protein
MFFGALKIILRKRGYEMENLKLSNYMKIAVLVPESHADLIREVMAKFGAGESDCYSHASFSVKGLGRFKPKEGAQPFIGEKGDMEMVPEERIETICSLDYLEEVIQEIKKAHPYEETMIDMYPIYQIALKVKNK